MGKYRGICMNKKKCPDDRMVFYETDDGRVSIYVKFEKENIWLTQKSMSELFECSVDNISLHLKNIYLNKELNKNATIEEYSIVKKEGDRKVQRKTLFYNLDAIVAVGYKVNTDRGIAFRGWATDKLKSYIIKGFAIDSERFKKGSKFDASFFEELLAEIREIRASERMAYQKITDIYATAIDYSPKSQLALNFFATVQNKLHFAVTGQTAAEIIKNRADYRKKNMGLTTWGKSPEGKILPYDIQIAKNYLSKKELFMLNKIVNMYIDYAEFQAEKGNTITMRQWSDKLDAFLKFNEQDVLKGHGNISNELANSFAKIEYEKYRVTQDKKYKSDFDKLINNANTCIKKNHNYNTDN